MANEENTKKVVLQNDQVLAQLKSIDGHATYNVLKRWQYLVESKTSMFYQSSSNPTFIPNLMLNGTT
jgi:hypothetical protein